jgi:hypothetical protein
VAEPGPEDPDADGPSALRAWRDRAGTVPPRASEWVDRRRRDSMSIDLACQYVERDRDLLTAILGSAIALRLFLFMVPTVAMAVGVTRLIAGPGGLEGLLEQSSVTGQLAQEISTATEASTSTLVVAIVTSVGLAGWAGRNLVIVLAACSGTAWRLDATARRATLRVSATVTVLVLALMVTAAVTNRLRAEFGFAGSTTSWVLGVCAFSAAWFAVMWTLPRGTPDPGAVLPGAMLVGLSLTVLQWFMQFYLPSRLERSSAVAGGVGTAVAILGSMFLVGRVMASSFVVNALIYERLGSISVPLFGLPIIRRLPERFPAVVRWFDLPTSPGAPDDRRDPEGSRGSGRGTGVDS